MKQFYSKKKIYLLNLDKEKFFLYLISHSKATPRRIQCSGGLAVFNHKGVI